MGECIVKLVGLGIKSYFSDNWNKFDFVLVLSTIMLSTALSSLRMLKSAKVGRLARISKIGKS